MTTRVLVLRILVIAVLGIFVVRLGWLQLVRGGEYRQASENNHQRWIRLPGSRGLIKDRNGQLLAKNEERPSLWLVSGEVPRKGGYWENLLHTLVGIGIYPDIDSAKAALDDARRTPAYQPVRLKSDLSITEITRVEERLVSLPGVFISGEPRRVYPNSEMAAHVLGYLREVTPEQLSNPDYAAYRMGDPIGQVGVEKAFESTLRGTDGRREVEVDAAGRVLKQYAEVEPEPGQDVTLTIDLSIQREAETALGSNWGAAVVLDPRTGEVLAMASHPAYDGNQFSEHVPKAVMTQLLADRALVARATQGRYPPGSVFKIVTAATVLEKGVLPPDPTFFCDGSYMGIKCWKHDGHGLLTFTQAFAESCNVAFMKMAEASGVNALDSMAHRFGLGQPVDLGGIMEEDPGQVPDPAFMEAHHHKWQLGDTLQMGIGQSALAITPLQAARIIAAMANGGNLVQPMLVKSAGDKTFSPAPLQPIGLKADTMDRIEVGLKAVTSGEGTANTMDPTLHIAGKTGTAQNPQGDDHAWFVGYAPYENPRVAVAVIVEHGGHGGAVAAPIAERIIRVALNGPGGTNGQ